MTRPCFDAVPPLDADGLLSAAMIEAAQRRVRAVLAPTPMVACAGRGAWLKLESLQVTGAYKVRGGAQCAGRADRARRSAAGVRGLGRQPRAGRGLGGPPARSPGHRGGAGLGAARQGGGLSRAGRAGGRRRLLEARPDVVVVPVGGGGLAAGMGTVLRRHGVRVVGVQVAGADGLRRALSGQPLRTAGPTIADGIRVATPGILSGRLCAAVLETVLVVSEDEVVEALASLALDSKVVAEGAGAVAVAALSRVAGRRRIAVVSGGNVDPLVLARVGMTRRSPADVTWAP